MNKIKTTVPEELSGRRLDHVLANLFPQHSRSRLQSWINAGYVKVNDKTLKQKDPVRTGEFIEITPLYTPQQGLRAEPIPLEVLFEDEEILVINKPAGLVVHPGAGNPAHTLQNALLHYDANLEKVARAGIVQRLDKDTSGIMIIARTPESHTYLVDQLQRRLVQREYRAIVTGVMTAGGTVDAAIGRHPVSRKKMSVTAKGKPAVTHYRILKKYPAHTYIKVYLETGRTHQIRVHLSHINFPVVGDPVYGGRRRFPKNISVEMRDAIQSFPRQALHAYSLKLLHPKSGEERSWTAPVPEDMKSFLKILEENENAGKV